MNLQSAKIIKNIDKNVALYIFILWIFPVNHIFNFQLSVFNFLGRSGEAVGLSAISLLASFPTRTQKLSSALRQAQ